MTTPPPEGLPPYPPVPEGFDQWEYRGLGWDNGRTPCVFSHFKSPGPWHVDDSGEGSPVGNGNCPSLHYIEAVKAPAPKPVDPPSGQGESKTPLEQLKAKWDCHFYPQKVIDQLETALAEKTAEVGRLKLENKKYLNAFTSAEADFQKTRAESIRLTDAVVKAGNIMGAQKQELTTLREEVSRLREGIHDGPITIRQIDGGFEIVRDGEIRWSTDLESVITQSFPAAHKEGGDDGN